MADVKRVLVVDDRYEMLDFLQSMLEITSEQYEVSAVPSAEEALLELRQKDFDLLLTDARLPGMSGFDLVRRLRKTDPDLPAIMITAYSSEQGQREADDLGVYHYFQKPLDTDEVLTAVHTALYGELVVHADSESQPRDVDGVVPDAVPRRLETLRADTGATRIALAAASGQILLQVGHGRGLNLPTLAALMAKNLDNSFLLARELGGNNPTTIQYHAGDRVELYIANVGREYFLAIFFDAQARRGRMGTIWVFAQRAIKDLLDLLPESGVGDSIEPQSAPLFSVARSSQQTQPLPRSRRRSGRSTSSRETKPAPSLPEQSDAELDTGAAVKEGADSLSEPLAPSESDGFFTLEEVSDESAEMDTFWEEAASEVPTPVGEQGALTFEAAQRMGLIPDTSVEEAETASAMTQAKADAVAGEDASKEGEASDVAAEGMPLLDELNLDGSTDVDAFWDAALAEEGSAGALTTDGMSYEEAKREGLVPADDAPEKDQD
jgi:CheY-like chemotaxis protein